MASLSCVGQDAGEDALAMTFHRRPDLQTRQQALLLHGGPRLRRASSARDDPSAIPVQLVGGDGRPRLGMPVALGGRQESPRDPQSLSGTTAPGRAQENRISRLLVTSNPLHDSSARRRFRQVQIAFGLAVLAGQVLTLAMLFPSSTESWFLVHAPTSSIRFTGFQRVQSVRPTLLVHSIGCNLLGAAGAVTKRGHLLTIYVLGVISTDIWTFALLLPHAFYMLRYLYDVLLIMIAFEMRALLDQPWFITNFHRLRY